MKKMRKLIKYTVSTQPLLLQQRFASKGSVLNNTILKWRSGFLQSCIQITPYLFDAVFWQNAFRTLIQPVPLVEVFGQKCKLFKGTLALRRRLFWSCSKVV